MNLNTFWGSLKIGEEGSLKIGDARSSVSDDRGSMYMDFPVSGSNQRGNIKSNAVEKCNYDVVRACVNSKFEDMNFIELAICVSELPACYVGVWAICGWDKCIAPLYQ